MRQTHFFSVLAVFLVVCSVGCRMCGTQYDYCTPAYTGRTEDYRGCDPLYRAGSIFSYDNCGGNEISEINEIIDGEEQIIRATNAGNFGVTTPFGQSSSGSSRLEPRSGTSIGRPTLAPNPNGNYPNGNKNTDEPEDEPENENILPG
ncbi:MAG: hypothetical protein LBP87_01845, partial [Planctomycetaceae bacterium]|nr:hypothetical protein [Planctomycetaceae bacterium]